MRALQAVAPRSVTPLVEDAEASLSQVCDALDAETREVTAAADPPVRRDGVYTARLIGGQFDGMIVEIDQVEDVLKLGGRPLGAWGSPDLSEQELERIRQDTTMWEYRFVELEDSDEGHRQAVYRFVRTTPS